MKNIVIVAALAVLLSGVAQAQTWSYFFHPRPPLVAHASARLAPDGTPILDRSGVPLDVVTAVQSPYTWAFVPNLQVVATAFRFSNDPSKSIVTSALNAFGIGVSLAHMGQTADGVNFTDWSASVAVLPTMDHQIDPNFQPMIALEVGVQPGVTGLVLDVGVGYDINKRPDTKNGLCLFFALSGLPFLN